MKRKLIEVALPLDAINAASIRENSIRHGYPANLHLWWARRPLAACRAVMFAQLVDDPSSHPDRFPTEQAQESERKRLFDLIGELVEPDNAANSELLKMAQQEIRKSCNNELPSILDPFAGGGSIPLEAQRLGLDAYASDLNPVAVLINQLLIESPVQFANQPPVNSRSEPRTRWIGIEGLCEDIRSYGSWIRDEAERRIGHLYPKTKLPDGTYATVISWIWTRTVRCPNPACQMIMPIASNFWLCKKRGREAWINPIVEGRSVRFEIGFGSHGPPSPPKTGRGSRFRCLCCGESTSADYIRAEGLAGRIHQQMMAVAAQGKGRRIYVPPDEAHISVANIDKPKSILVGELPEHALGFRIQAYGMTKWSDLFTSRQLIALSTLSNLIRDIQTHVERDAHVAGFSELRALEYSRSVAMNLAFLLDKQAQLGCNLSVWGVEAECPLQLFTGGRVPMKWDFAESNIFSHSSGSWDVLLRNHLRALQSHQVNFVRSSKGSAVQRDARLITTSAVVVTDPPYYDNIGYACLSDFFYVWLRQSLQLLFPDLFSTLFAPKEAELIAFHHSHGGSNDAANQYFERGFVEVFSKFRDITIDAFPMSFFYAFKQSELAADGQSSTGWSTMLEGLLAAGWMVTATWPMRTERAERMRAQDSNALASSIVLACRLRPADAGITDRQGLLRSLRNEMPGPVRELQRAAVAPVDLRQAAIGPGMAVFSRYARVVEADGQPMRVHTALGLINQVLEAVLGEAEADLDPESRWAVAWYSQHFEDEGPYGVAEQLAVSMNVAVETVARAGMVESSGGRVRLLSRDEIAADWSPPEDARAPIWLATQHLVRRLIEDGETAASTLLAQIGARGEACRALAYRLYTICETASPNLAGPYNALAAAWPEIHRQSTQAPPPPPTPEPQLFNP